MSLARLVPSALALSCSLAFAADVPVDAFGRPVDVDSRLATPAPARPSDTPEPDGTGSPAVWRLLPFQTRTAGADPRAVAVGHITGQRRPDVVVATSYYFDPDTDYHLLLFRPDGAASFLPPLLYPYGQTPSFPSIAVLELDGTFGADVVVGGDTGLTRFRATAAGTLVASAPESTQPAVALAAVDLDRDGRKDVAAISWSEGGRLYRNLGNGSLQATTWSPSVDGYGKMGQGDINGDGHDDIVVGNGYGMAPYVLPYLNAGDGTLMPLPTLDGVCPGGSWGSVGGVGIGDVNGDGHADIVVSSGGNSPSSCVMIFQGDGEGGFDAPIYLASRDVPQTLRVADIDGDGRDDIIVAHGGWMALGVYLQQENGSLAPERLFPLPYASHYYAHSFEVVDLDMDGCADIALVDYNNGLVTLKGTGCNRIYASGFE